MWEKYLVVGGTEIANATRTAQYAAAMGLGWLNPQNVNDYLPLMLGDGARYETPLVDDAPWIDPDVPESFEFLGFYPLGIAGIEDSTRSTTVTEYITDGGSAGRIRHTTKAVVVNGVLVATSEAGAEYGMRWLRQATLGGPCDGSPFGADLCYLSSSPQLDIPSDPAALALIDGGGPDAVEGPILDGGTPSADGVSVYDGGDPWTTTPILEHSEDIFTVPPPVVWDPTACLVPYERTLRKFKVTSGPSITQKQNPTRGALWSVQFAGVAGVPWEFGAAVEVVNGFLSDEVTGIATNIDTEGYVVLQEDCAETIWAPLVDPLCPVLVNPPGPPDVALGCAEQPSSWLRRQFTVPDTATRLWSDMVPILNVHAPVDTDLRNLRVRFYADPYGLNDPAADPCSFCGNLLISYVPAGAILTFDAASEQVYVTTLGGITRRADSVVFGADGKPFDWPALTCGFGYVVTIDLPQIQATPVIDLTLIPRAS